MSQPDQSAHVERFRRTATQVLALIGERAVGEDSSLAPRSSSSADAVRHVEECVDALGALDDIDDTVLDPQDRVDLELLRGEVSRRVWELGERPDLRPGPQVHAARLWYDLDAQVDGDDLVARVESDLMAVEAELSDLVALVVPSAATAPLEDTVADALRVVAEACPPGADHGQLVRDESESMFDLLRHSGFVSVPGEVPTVTVTTDDAVDRFAVWSLVCRRGVPGEALREQRSSEFVGSTAARHRLPGATFVAGWPLYAERALARIDCGDEAVGRGRLLHQLVGQARADAEAVVDLRVHSGRLSRHEAVSFLMSRGHLGREAAQTRVQHIAAAPVRSCAAAVGLREITDLVADLARDRPSASVVDVHDEVLSHGSPPPRHLRALLDLPDR